ncbi:hypothetical protein AAFF_G00222590 [Aldrovandia affinis]|uniref:Uncharacterized protein n=1 Tax=Aldrovandia affinis TaxID=143900 RepID=A0AAD7W3V3_9TELE|nr:hypothetical protein AAFF_G00222590 [Aldrovandia affinis]
MQTVGLIHTLEQCLNRMQTVGLIHTLEQCLNRMQTVGLIHTLEQPNATGSGACLREDEAAFEAPESRGNPPAQADPHPFSSYLSGDASVRQHRLLGPPTGQLSGWLYI